MKNRSEQLHNKHYSADNVVNYEKVRVGARWTQEQNYVREMLSDYKSDSYSVIDAPIGTNRFSDILKSQSNIDKVYGFDYSQDMLDISSKKNMKNIHLQRLDLLTETIPVTCEVSICSRILNLFNESDAVKILSNVLDSTLETCFVSIRTHEHDSLQYNQKLYCHSEKTFNELLQDKCFIILNEENTPKNHKPGIMRLLTLVRQT